MLAMLRASEPQSLRASEPQSLRAAIAAKNVGSSSQSLMVLITHTMRSKPTARSRVWPRRRSERRPSGRSSVRRRHRHPDRVTDHRLSLAALECEGGQVLITRLQRLLLVTGGVLEVHQEQAGQNKTAPAIPAAARAVLGFVLPARAADSYPVRTWFQDKHWTVVQMHSLTSQAQFCQLPGTRGIASFSLSQNDKGDDPQAESPERGAHWAFGGVRLQIDRNAPWGVEPRAFQAPDLLVIPLLPAEAGQQFLAELLNGRTLASPPVTLGSRNLSLAGSSPAFNRLTDCLDVIRRRH